MRAPKRGWGRRAVPAVGLLLALVLTPLAPAFGAPVGDLAIQSIDTSAWPKVKLDVVLPAEMLSAGQLGLADFSVSENGADIRPSAVRELAGARKPLSVVLLLDASGSMKGRAIEDAKQAAEGFVAAMASGDKVALIAFNGKASVLSTFSTDAASLDAAISGVAATDGTALYDALLVAVRQFDASPESEKAIVLLSDGGDSVSQATLAGATQALASSGVPLYAVALQTNHNDPAALQSLSSASGGRLVSIADSRGLTSLFAGIALQLQSPYEVTFTSLRPPAKQLDVKVVVSSRDQRAGVTATMPNPDFGPAALAAVTAAPPLPNGAWPGILAALAFLAVALLAGGILLLTRPEPNTIEQLRFYEQLHGRTVTAPTDEAVVDPESARGRMLSVAGSVASRGGFDAAIRRELERAGLPLRSVEYMLLHVTTVLGVGLVVQFIADSLPVTVVAVALVTFGPILLLSYLARKRTQAFQEQLPDALNLLAGSLRGGWGLLQAIGMVVGEMSAPAGPEFGRVVTEARLGIPLEEALGKMADRMGSEDFRWAVTAIAIQREVGGNLAEVLDLVAQTVRERAALRRQVVALTGEGRLSAMILIVLPFLEAFVLWLLNPTYFSKLFSSSIGIQLTVAAAVLIVVGSVWLRRIVKIEV